MTTTTKDLGIIIENKRPVVSSRDVARVFEKEHFNVIRDIKNLECDEEFNAINFEAVDYTDAKGEKRPMYLITRDGFTILAMGFTGKKAIDFKLKYITAFNAMEEQLKNPFNIPKTLPEALRLAAQLEEKRLVLEAKIEHDAPHTNLGKTITASHDCITVAEFVPIMRQAGIKYGYDGKRLWQNNLYDMLRKDGFLLTRPKNMPSADARDEKIFFVEEKTNYDAYGNAHINKQTLITGKGQTHLINYYTRKKDN